MYEHDEGTKTFVIIHAVVHENFESNEYKKADGFVSKAQLEESTLYHIAG